MDYMQQTSTHIGLCHLRLVDFEVHENCTSHQTLGLCSKHLVVRRGQPFRLTLKFHGRPWDLHAEALVLEVFLGTLSERILVHFSNQMPDTTDWSAKIFPGNAHPDWVSVHVCSPVRSSVAVYDLVLHMETIRSRRSYIVGSFVLLCNPWLRDDPVYMPDEAHRQEYVQSDYGVLYMGTELNLCQRPWSFGQYEPGVLEACLKLLEVSPQHQGDASKDLILRADPVYLCRVLCAMVNCNDDLGILQGKWQGSYEGGVSPTEWNGSADILQCWASTSCRPVRYGQCWVFASVLCTVMRALGIPSRVVTVFNAGHDTNANLTIEEYYSSTGEKLNQSKDSLWNFHVWVECWMRRTDLSAEFDGWQVVDPTPQEKSNGIYCCGPCPVVAVQQRCLGARFDASFIFAAVDADVIRLIVRSGLVVGRTVDTEGVGQLIYTKAIGSDSPQNLTTAYKQRKTAQPEFKGRRTAYIGTCRTYSSARTVSACVEKAGHPVSAPDATDLEVSLGIKGEPTVGQSVGVQVTITNNSGERRLLVEHVNAQIKEYNTSPQKSFWKLHQEVMIQPHQVLALQHTISASEYESALAADDIVNLAVVIKDSQTDGRVLDTQEFNISPLPITIKIEGSSSVLVNRRYKARLCFTNGYTRALSGAVLTVEGSGLMEGKQEARVARLKPNEKMEKTVSIMATSPGTKVLMASVSHGNSPTAVSRSFRKVSVTES